MSRLRFKVGEIATVITDSGWAEVARRELGKRSECEVLQVGEYDEEDGAWYDYAIRATDGREYVCLDSTLRKKRRPPPSREEPQVTKLKRDIKRWVKMPAREKAKLSLEGKPA